MIKKNIILTFLCLFILNTKVSSQNSYGWERIFDSIYGLNGFYIQQNHDSTKYWMVRPAGDMIGSGQYDFIKYNLNSNSWFTSSHSFFIGVYYSYYIGGGHSISGHALPPAFFISPEDTNFVLVNTVVTHIQYPPIDIRLFYSYNNGSSKSDVTYFEGKSLTGLGINPVNDSICFAVSSDTIFKSTDRGISWFPKTNIPYFNGTLSINPLDTSFIYALDDSLFISINGGNNFTYLLNKKFNRIVYNFNDSSMMANSQNKLYKSVNHGLNWNVIYTFPDSLICFDTDPDNVNIVYAGTSRGLFRSTDVGLNFSLFNNSFSPSKKVTGICKEKNRNYIYVSTEEAVYKCWNSFVINIRNISTFNPGLFYLNQNYPNPFNPNTKLRFGIPRTGFVVLKVYDILGNEITTLANESKSAGIYEVEFNTTSAGKNFSSGVYFYSLFVNNDLIDTKKMLLLK